MYYIGIDLGGTNIAVGLVDEEGKIIYKKSTPTMNERSSDEIVRDMGNLVNTVIEESGISKEEVTAVGVGSPGIPNVNEGKIVYSNNIKFRDVDLRTTISEITDLKVYVNNDANCAALAEMVAGAAKGTHSSVTITLGTGVGSGIIIDGKILSGFNGAAGELGHTIVEIDGEQCNCGRKGCWERYASATALINQTIAAGEENPTSLMHKVARDGNIYNASARTAFDAAKQGDEPAKQVVGKYIKYVAEGLSNVINIFQPEVICIGGGISNEGENLLAPLRALVERRMYGTDVTEEELPRTRIVKAQMGNDAGIVGAAMLVKQGSGNE